MNEKTIISASTLTGTLTGYYLSAHRETQRIPFMLIGGFVGTLIGELVTRKTEKQLSGPKRKEENEILWI